MTHPDTPVAELMTREPVALSPSDSLAEARFLLERYPFRHLPVVDLRELVGMVSDRDLLLASSLPPRRRRANGERDPVRVQELMTTPVCTIAPSARARTAVRTLLEARISALPVVADGRLVGIVTAADLLEHYAESSAFAAG